MNIFEHAQNATVSGSIFNQVGRDQINTAVLNQYSSKDVLQSLLPATVLGAIYNSSQREHASTCLPHTRTDVLQIIMDRVDNGDGNLMYWLSGPAGSGKSTIAHTIAKQCEGDGKLAATFFFSQGDALRSSTRKFFPTLAYQLGISVPSAKASMQEALQQDPSLCERNLETQFKKLIHIPILKFNTLIAPMVVVVDALDECEDKDGVGKLVEVITTAFHERPFPLWFLFTSRVDDDIEGIFADPVTKLGTRRLPLEQWEAHADVRVFLQIRFREIRAKKHRTMRGISEPWPSHPDLKKLVEKSEGLFIWASTLVKFIESSSLPHQTLQTALNIHTGLDPLYRQVFLAAPRHDTFERVIGTIILLQEPLSIRDLGALLELGTDVIHAALTGFGSILKIPEKDYDLIRPFHASLHDFLINRQRSQEFCIHPGMLHSDMLRSCLKRITLRCPVLGVRPFYAITSWCYHLRGAISNEVGDPLLLSQWSGDLMDTIGKLESDRFERFCSNVDIVEFMSTKELMATTSQLKLLGTKYSNEYTGVQLECLIQRRDYLIKQLDSITQQVDEISKFRRSGDVPSWWREHWWYTSSMPYAQQFLPKQSIPLISIDTWSLQALDAGLPLAQRERKWREREERDEREWLFGV